MSTLTAVRSGVRAATSGAALVARRRSASDAGLLVLTAIVLAATVALSLTIPRVVEHAADEAVRAAVVDAGTSADLVARAGAAVRPGFGSGASSTRDPNVAATQRTNAASVREALPDPL